MRAIVVFLVVAGCSTGTFGPEGGVLVSEDGAAALVIPAGALATETRISLTRRAVPGIGFEGDEAWSVSFDGVLVAPLSLHLPCRQGCRGDERLGGRGYEGILPIVDGTQLRPELRRLDASITQPGLFGVTRCAHRDCLQARIDGDTLEVSWLAPSARVDGQPSPVRVPAGITGKLSFHLDGPDGRETLIVPLDPLAPPEGMEALAGPEGGVRLVWDPLPRREASLEVIRRECGLDVRFVASGDVAGLWDADAPPGRWLDYSIGERVAQVQTAIPAGRCAIITDCGLLVQHGESADQVVEVFPELADGRYVLSFTAASQAEIAGLASLTLDPATTSSWSRLTVQAGTELSGGRALRLEAHDPRSGVTCDAPVRVTVHRESVIFPISVKGASPVSVRARGADGEWRVLAPVGLRYDLEIGEDDDPMPVIAVDCGGEITRTFALDPQGELVDASCPRPTLVFTGTLTGLDPAQCARVAVGGEPSPCAGADFAVTGTLQSFDWLVSVHDTPDGPARALLRRRTYIDGPMTASLLGADPTTLQQLSVVGGGEPVVTRVSAMTTFGSRVPLGSGDRATTFGAPIYRTFSLEVDVTAGDERIRRQLVDLPVGTVIDFTDPFPEVTAAIDGEVLRATLPRYVVLELQSGGHQIFVASEWLVAHDGIFPLPPWGGPWSITAHQRFDDSWQDFLQGEVPFPYGTLRSKRL